MHVCTYPFVCVFMCMHICLYVYVYTDVLVSLVQMLMRNSLPRDADDKNAGAGASMLMTTMAMEPSQQSQSSSSSSSSSSFVSSSSMMVPCHETVRAHAFVAMGKLCLRDKSRARAHVNVFLRELHVVPTSSTSSTSAAMARGANGNETDVRYPGTWVVMFQ